jgi:hypothetical protein
VSSFGLMFALELCPDPVLLVMSMQNGVLCVLPSDPLGLVLVDASFPLSSQGLCRLWFSLSVALIEQSSTEFGGRVVFLFSFWNKTAEVSSLAPGVLG